MEANKHLPKPPFTFLAGILEESLSEGAQSPGPASLSHSPSSSQPWSTLPALLWQQAATLLLAGLIQSLGQHWPGYLLCCLVFVWGVVLFRF